MLGIVNFYRRYNSQIAKCAELLAPINELTKARSPNTINWTPEHEVNKVKEVLSCELILKLPDLDREFIVQTDASDTRVGACLLQEFDGGE